MATRDAYVDEIRKELGLTPAWLPQSTFKVGDIVSLTETGTIKLTDLVSLGISTIVEQTDSIGDIEYASKGAVAFMAKPAGAAPVSGSLLSQAEAGVSLTFSRIGASALFAKGCAIQRIANLSSVGEELVAMQERRKWNSRAAIVTEAVTAEMTTIVVSASSSATIEFSGSITSQAALMARADLSSLVHNQRSIAVLITCRGGLTPLLRLHTLTRPLFGQPEFRQRAAVENIRLGKVAISDGWCLEEITYRNLA